MNILFVTTYEVHPQKGGTERITHTVSQSLTEQYGHRCYSAFSQKEPNQAVEFSKFIAKIHLPDKKDCSLYRLRSFIELYQIDRIIIQGSFLLTQFYKKAISDLNCKLIFVHHFAPGWEENFISIESYHYMYKMAKGLDKIKPMIKYILAPYRSPKKIEELRKCYKSTYECADRVVLLSKRFQNDFMKYANIEDSSKFSIIPNALSFNEFSNLNEIANKDKIVLIVSRLEEKQKRISLALTIWGKVKEYSESKDWKLNIIGHGMHKKKYEEYVTNNNLKDIYFLGMQNPIEYYKESSIFMLTSESEGWGLTLTEAQQNGVVPIAFDTYASLHDIITHKKNGYIIENNEIDKYASSIIELMSNKERRKEMAYNAVKTSNRFRIDSIAAMWNDLIGG